MFQLADAATEKEMRLKMFAETPVRGVVDESNHAWARIIEQNSQEFVESATDDDDERTSAYMHYAWVCVSCHRTRIASHLSSSRK